MLGPRLVIDFARVIRILRGLQKVFDEIHRVVQKEVVSFADVDVQLPFQLWTKLRPITFQDVAEVVSVALRLC